MTRNGHKNNKISLQIKSNCAFFLKTLHFFPFPFILVLTPSLAQ